MTHPEPFIRSIPLSRLELAPENVRKTPADPAAFAELKASIAAHGLLENLIVRIEDTGHDPGSGPEQAHVDRCAVVAGGRRLAAMKALASEGALDADHPVPCRVIGAAESAEEFSLAENVVRVAMHPADQVVAFLRLSEAGVSASAIAARFGVTERLVEQRLRLGGVAPELLDAYRAQEMDLDTLKAFTVTTDHARQRAVWEQVKEQGYGPSGWQVKRMLTEESVPAVSAVARFVGAGAYEAAGGTLTRDLFAGEDGSGTWFDDPVLLNELATEKLRAAADDLTTLWKWAKTMVEADWSAVAGFGRISPEPGVPTEEEKAERESLRARHDELVNMDEDEWPDELIEEAEAIKSRLNAIEEVVESRAAFRAQDYAIAGCIATVGHDGKLKVIEGLVRPEDMPERTDAGNDDGTDPGRVDAPLITEPLTTPPDPRARAREAIRRTLENAARHYPLPVTLDGEAVPRRAFLEDVVHAESWRGLAFGVFKSCSRYRDEPDLNFHGLILAAHLPTVHPVDGPAWSIRADVGNCPELEHVLPARKEAVETPFLEEMREAARTAIYRAMAAADPAPSIAFEDWRRARAAGVELQIPAPALHHVRRTGHHPRHGEDRTRRGDRENQPEYLRSRAGIAEQIGEGLAGSCGFGQRRCMS